MKQVLVTGATGCIGRAVIAELIAAGVPLRALTRDPDSAALPANVEVVTGDFSRPDSLEHALQGIGAVFLLWTAPPDTVAAVVERLAAEPRRVVLSSPLHTPHPFFQQTNPMAHMHAEIERLIAASGLESTFIRPGMLASNARPGGGLRSGRATSCGGPMAQPRPPRSMSAMSRRLRPGRCMRTGTRAATTC